MGGGKAILAAGMVGNTKSFCEIDFLKKDVLVSLREAAQLLRRGSWDGAHRMISSHLMEAISGYTDDHPFYFFGSGRSISLVVYRGQDHFKVLSLKRSRFFHPTIEKNRANVSGVSIDQIFTHLWRAASEEKLVKKVFPKLSPKEFKTYLLQREGFPFSACARLFPDLAKTEEGEGVDVDGMTVIGLENFKKTEGIVRSIREGIKLVKGAGFSHLLYGDVTLIAAKGMGSVSVADYSVESDKIRIKASDKDLVHSIVHELGHRQYYKFSTDKSAVNGKYFETKDKPVPRFKIGDIVVPRVNKRPIKITDRSLGYRGDMTYRGFYTDDPARKLKIPEAALYDATDEKGKSFDADKPEFRVTLYAMTNPREFFAEVFAYALVEKKPNLLAWIKEVTR